MAKQWRVGHKVKLNVYDADDNPVCQCHTPEMAARIVAAMNYYRLNLDRGKIRKPITPLDAIGIPLTGGKGKVSLKR